MNAKHVVMASAVAMVVAMAGVSAQASLLVYDQFDGTAGTSVTAHTPDVGGGTWTVDATSQLALTGTGTANTGSAGYGQGTIGVAVDQSVQMGVLASFNMGTASWVGVALSESSDPGWFFGYNNHIWTRVNSDGSVNLGLAGWWHNGSPVTQEWWAGGTVANWDASKPHTLQLNVKADSFDAEVLVDGVSVVAGNYGMANGWYHTDPRTLNSATFHIDGGTGSSASFDYIAAGATPIAIPEPASLGLLATAGLMLTRRRK